MSGKDGKRLEDARKAFEKGDLEASRKAHEAKRIEEDIHQTAAGKYVGDAVYGGLDGIVTTFAIVAGATGATLSSIIVLILGVANLLADGLSMALGNYLGTKSEIEYAARERRREEWEVENETEGEIEEIRQIYARKGFQGEDLERAVKVITSDKKVWVDTMMRDELNIIEEFKSPVRSGLATFIAFVAAGSVPLLFYVGAFLFPSLSVDKFAASTVLTAIALFSVGSLRTIVTGKRWWKAGLEMTLVGGIASAAAYVIGYLLQGLAP
ncbi:MAG: VIT1/CCC1 transporter family protein [Thaumarchaeota archaeon]|nr:VIT1/CCC1 transporter family protein [Nitrososphaerota archaeon]